MSDVFLQHLGAVREAIQGQDYPICREERLCNSALKPGDEEFERRDHTRFGSKEKLHYENWGVLTVVVTHIRDKNSVSVSFMGGLY